VQYADPSQSPAVDSLLNQRFTATFPPTHDIACNTLTYVSARKGLPTLIPGPAVSAYSWERAGAERLRPTGRKRQRQRFIRAARSAARCADYARVHRDLAGVWKSALPCRCCVCCNSPVPSLLLYRSRR
jgi:hypothetical protein